jgi:hypothetical protein
MDASSGPRRHRASRYERIEGDGYLAIDVHWGCAGVAAVGSD